MSDLEVADGKRGNKSRSGASCRFEICIGETDIQFSWENLYAKNKELIDRQADRFFFVPDPVQIHVSGSAPGIAQAMKYPGDESRGYRRIPYAGSLYLPRADLASHPHFIAQDLVNNRVIYEERG
jgi:glutamyl-tRNA synthetase